MTPKSLVTGLAIVATAWLAPSFSAQDANSAPALGQLLNGWKAQHGSEWHVRTAEDSGYARILFGGTAQGTMSPKGEADFFTLARTKVTELAPMFGVTSNQLINDEVLLIPMAAFGSTDKITVRMSQAINGVPVEGGSVNVLFTPSGDMLSYDAQVTRVPANFDTVPTVDPGTAIQTAVNAFEATTGMPVTSSGNLELNIVGEDSEPTLSWRIQLWNEAEGFASESYTYQIAAQGTARVVREDNAIHNFDIGGTVSSNATPGNLPDATGNNETQQAMSYMTVTGSGIGTTTTDVNGNFNFAGATGPISITFRYNGSFNNVDNESGAEYTLVQSLTGTGNSVLMNPTSSALVTAEANSFQRINQMRDWTRATNPADSKMDFVNDADANIGSNCNAFYDGNSTNYYTAGGGCVNTAYSTVIYHEQGHWQNDRYNSGNGSDGFGEGNADVFAMYVSNNPIVGEDFTGSGFIRTGLNNRQYCGDGNNGCYGQVHADGEVLMGALWKVRANLQSTLGNGAGGDLADTLFLGTMNSYDQTNINSIIEIHWLTLDDDNGNINDSTPNWTEINDGFLAQGFPGFAPNGAPSASFDADVTGGSAPLSVNFLDASVGDTLTGWSWDFGDGGTSTAQNPNHIYTVGGTFDVSLTVSNALGSDTATIEDYISVIPGGPASATPRNGSGVNPNIFTSTTLPLLGTTWVSSVDAGSVGGTGLTFAIGHLDSFPGLPTAFGELLIDTTSESALLNFGFIVGGTATHNEPVPFDVNLVGLGISTQVFLNNVGGFGKLTNAIDLVIGTF